MLTKAETWYKITHARKRFVCHFGENNKLSHKGKNMIEQEQYRYATEEIRGIPVVYLLNLEMSTF